MPVSSTADCTAAAGAQTAAASAEAATAEGEPAAGGEADAGSGSRGEGGTAGECTPRAASARPEAKVASPTRTAANPTRKSRITTDNEFQSWMEQMRGRCQVLESEVATHVADAQCEGAPTRASASTSAPERAVESAEPCVQSAAPSRLASSSELANWMSRMRARCQVLESTPGSTSADAKNELSSYDGTGANRLQHNPSSPSGAAPGPKPKPRLAALAAPLEAAKPPPVEVTAEHLALRLRLRDGSSLKPAERLQVWPSLLLRDPAAGAGGGGRPLPALAHLLGADEEDVLFEAGAADASSSSAAARLAAAFSEKYVSSLACQASSEEDSATTIAPVYSALAQLLRYHYPATACAIEAICVPAGFTLAEVLGVVCGGPAGLAQCLLTPHGGGEAEALLLFCDLIVMEEEDVLLLLTAAVLLSEVVPEPGASFEHLKELIRSKRGLGGLGSRGLDGVSQCVAAARALMDTTPVSLTTALAADERARARLRLPMCAVAPDEALHHIYERPSGSWRLVLVDVRMRASERALPVCMRLGQLPHNQRRQMLRELPYEESIHLCLLGDGPAMPGDDAFELCRHLVSPNVQRKHVSVVDGGWPAVEELADSLRLHLMPLEPEEPTTARSSLKEARAAVAGVAGQVASATESATAVGQKMAQRMLKGVRGGVLSVLGGESSKSAEAKHPTIEV